MRARALHALVIAVVALVVAASITALVYAVAYLWALLQLVTAFLEIWSRAA